MPDLAICIPTFNRAPQLKANLTHLARLAARHDMAIYVSDNCSTDDTEEVVREASLSCPQIHYHRNPTNVGMDKNFAVVLGLPPEPYVWLLGDDDLIAEAALAEVLALIEQKVYDLILVNGGSKNVDSGRVQGEPTSEFSDPERLLVDLGWHATWISGLVMGRRLLDQMRVEAYDGSYFSHFIALFEALQHLPNPRVLWHAPSSFYPSHLAQFSWSQRAIEIFATRWLQAVWLIPGNYDPAARRSCILAHGVRTGLLTSIGLMNLRAKGCFNSEQALRHRDALRLASPCSWWQILAISIMPIPIVRMLRTLALAVRSVARA